MWLQLLPSLATLLPLITAEASDGIPESTYHGPPQARELFSYNGVLYYFYSDRVTYDEAKAICEASLMHLTNLDDPGKAKFAAESISEAWMIFEDMWIGAQKGKLGQWTWQWTNKRIPEQSQMMGNNTYMYPPWIDKEIPMIDGKNCLAVGRHGNNDPIFIDLDCKLPRPFICEQNVRENRSEPWTAGTVKIFDIEYILYHGRLSWPAAVSFCRQQGFALATVQNMTVARKLAKAMLKSRPEFADAWIGGNLKDDDWIWVESGEEIITIPAEYKDPAKKDTPGNIITPQFPPWLEAEPRKGRECVLFDRHRCDEPKFIDLKCNRQRDFICIKREKENEKEEARNILDREKKRYIFFPVSATWDEAKQICDEESNTTTMLHLTDIDESKFIMQAMSDARKPIDHIWLGGKVVNNEWVWVGRGEKSETTKIPMIPDDSGFPPWCDNETNDELACLNLDRQNYWTPLIYGLECNSTQAVVCVQPVEPNDRIVKYDGAGEHDPPMELRVTKLEHSPLSWREAETVCSKEVGSLWRPRFDLPDSQAAIDKFFTALKNGQNQEREVVVYHVDGGQYDASKKAWVHNKQLFNITTAIKPYDGDCLVGQINKTAASWTWFPVKCYAKLYSQIICEPRCPLTDLPYEQEHSNWICDAASSSIFDHKMINMRCNHRCPDNQVIQGPERYYCKKDKGWASGQSNIPAQSSKCKEVANGLDVFKVIPKGISKLAFVVDSTSDSPADYNATKYMIGNLVDYYRSHLHNIVVYVISIEFDPNSVLGAVIKVQNFKPTEECDKIKTKVLNPLVDTGEGIRDYSAGLAMISEALGDSNLGEANIIFIVPEANQRGLFKDAAEQTHKDATVFAIGTNRNAPISQLVDIASKIDGQSLAIQFKKPPQVVTAVKSLMADCSECKCASAFEDLIGGPLQEEEGRA